MASLITFFGCTKKTDKHTTDTANVEEITTYTSELVQYDVAENYKLKVKETTTGMRNIRITTDEQFNAYFDYAQPTNTTEKQSKIDFDKNFVLVMIGKDSNIETNFQIETIKNKNSKLEIKYCIAELDVPEAVEVQPIIILIIDKKYNKDTHFLLQ